MSLWHWALLLGFSSSSSVPKVFPTWPEYVRANRYECPGPFDTLKKVTRLELGGKTHRLEGHRMVAEDRDSDSIITFGILGAIKDASEDTQENLRRAVSWFRDDDVEWIIANGNVGVDEEDLEIILGILGASRLPSLVLVGNSESRTLFTRAFRRQAKRYPNLINGVWVRKIEADDAELWTLPGYHAQKFAYRGDGCRYTTDDVLALRRSSIGTENQPVMLISHGPPLGKGPRSLDVTTDAVNVGNPAITQLLAREKVVFGVFGHVLESGGRAVVGDLRAVIAPEQPSPALYVNAGSVSAHPQSMNDGTISHGLAMIVRIDGVQASYKVQRFASTLGQ